MVTPEHPRTPQSKPTGGEAGEERERRMADRRNDETLQPLPPRAAITEEAVESIEPDDTTRMLMSAPVAWVEPDVSLIELATWLETEAVGAVAVMSGGRLEGVASERDIVRALSLGGDPNEVWVGDLMAEAPVYADPDEAIITVAERMLDEGVRHLPVVSEGQVVGVVSARDALRVLADAWRRARTSGEE